MSEKKFKVTFLNYDPDPFFSKGPPPLKITIRVVFLIIFIPVSFYFFLPSGGVNMMRFSRPSQIKSYNRSCSWLVHHYLLSRQRKIMLSSLPLFN